MRDDDVSLIGFTVDSASTVTLTTYSYAEGGFDPILTIFDGDANFIDQNEDGLPGVVSQDPFTGQYFDAQIELALNPGNYMVALTQFDNFAGGATLADGFVQTGNANFTSTLGNCTNQIFCDVSGVAPHNNRDGHWTLNVTNVSVAAPILATPIPASALLFSSGLVLLRPVLRRRPTLA